jgi:hypothetical protein
MASVKNPTEAAEELVSPEDDEECNENPEEVTWSAACKESEQETIKKRKTSISCSISTHLSVKKALIETHRMFKATDKTFIMVSKIDLTIVISTAADFEKLSETDFKRFFPAEIAKGNTCFNLFFVADRSIHLLKKASFGFDACAAKHVWISDNPFLRNIGFIVRKSAEKMSGDQFTALLQERLSEFPFSSDDSKRHQEAKEALPFQGHLPKFVARASKNIFTQMPPEESKPPQSPFTATRNMSNFYPTFSSVFTKQENATNNLSHTVFCMATTRRTKKHAPTPSFSRTNTSPKSAPFQ